MRTTRAVTDPKPNNFLRVAEEQASLLKVGIFGHDDKFICFRIFPDLLVIRLFQTGVTYVAAFRINIGKLLG